MKTISLRLDKNMFDEMKKISDIFGISYSELIRNAINKEIEEKKKDFLYKLNQAKFVSSEEEDEIINKLSQMSDEDLKIVSKENIKL